MMFLFAVPVMEAMGVYLVPLMVGARNIAFPRLNTFSYFVYLFGGLMLVTVLLLNSGARRRLVLLRAAGRSRLHAGQAGRFLGAADHLHRGRGAGRGGGDRRHGVQDAGAGDDARPHPVVRLGDARHGLHDHLRHAGGRDGELVPADGSAGRHPLLQPGRGRRRAALPAPVLVLRPPRGLHHLRAGPRHGVVDRHDVHRPADRRLHGDGAVARRDRLHRLRPVGAPHVRHRPAAARADLLHRRQHDHRHPERDPDLLLDRLDLARHGRASRRRCCSSSASSPSSCWAD